jgi:hypothetical protein
VKKYLKSKTPCGVLMYLLAIARLTVVSCTPTTSAICVIVSGFKLRDAVLEEILLHLDDLAGDALDRLLALLDGVDQELAGAHAFAQVVALLLGERALGDELAVGVGDAQARDVVAVEVIFHSSPSFSTVTSARRRGCCRRRSGGRARDRACRFPRWRPGRRRRGAELAGEFGDAAAGEQLEVVADDPGGERVAAALGRELEEQALGEVLGADAGGIEGLQQLLRLLHGLERQAGLEGDVGGDWVRKPRSSRLPTRCFIARAPWASSRQLGLPHQVFLQRGLADERIEEMLPLFGVLGGVGLGAAGLAMWSRQSSSILPRISNSLEKSISSRFAAVRAGGAVFAADFPPLAGIGVSLPCRGSRLPSAAPRGSDCSAIPPG